MLTDEQINALLEDCSAVRTFEADRLPWQVHLWKTTVSAKIAAELCTRVLEAEARVKALEEAATPIVECYRMSGLCAENGESEEDHYHKMICRLEAALEAGR